MVIDDDGHSFSAGAEGKFSFDFVFISVILVFDVHFLEVFQDGDLG